MDLPWSLGYWWREVFLLYPSSIVKTVQMGALLVRHGLQIFLQYIPAQLRKYWLWASRNIEQQGNCGWKQKAAGGRHTSAPEIATHKNILAQCDSNRTELFQNTLKNDLAHAFAGTDFGPILNAQVELDEECDASEEWKDVVGVRYGEVCEPGESPSLHTVNRAVCHA